jgi:hypothetical protein
MLNGHVVDDLKKLTGHLRKKFRKLSITPKKLLNLQVPTRKAELVKWIETCILDDAFVKALYQQLAPLERAVLQETVHSPDAKLDEVRFEAKYGSIPRISIPSGWSSWRKKEENNVPDLALLLKSDGTIPPDLTMRLKKFIPIPKSVETEKIKDLPDPRNPVEIMAAMAENHCAS